MDEAFSTAATSGLGDAGGPAAVAVAALGPPGEPLPASGLGPAVRDRDVLEVLGMTGGLSVGFPVERLMPSDKCCTNACRRDCSARLRLGAARNPMTVCSSVWSPGSASGLVADGAGLCSCGGVAGGCGGTGGWGGCGACALGGWACPSGPSGGGGPVAAWVGCTPWPSCPLMGSDGLWSSPALKPVLLLPGLDWAGAGGATAGGGAAARLGTCLCGAG